MIINKRDMIIEIQNKFCGSSTEEKILNGINNGYKLAQEEMIDVIKDIDLDNYYKGKDINEADNLLLKTAKNNFTAGYMVFIEEMVDYLVYVKRQMISVPSMRDMRNELKIKIGELISKNSSNTNGGKNNG